MKEFPKGRLLIHGEQAINTSVSREDAARQALNINTVDNLGGMINNQSLASYEMENGVRFTFVGPTAPYTDRAVMLVVSPKDLEEVNTNQTIYDYDADTQREYWKLIISGLKALDEVISDEGNSPRYINLFAENVTDVTSLRHRTSRSVGLAHGHFVEIDRDAIQQPEASSAIDHLMAEQSVLRRKLLVEQFVARIKKQMDSEEEVNFLIRSSPPLGYMFLFNAAMTNNNLAGIQKFMQSHHEASEVIGRRYAKKAEVIAATKKGEKLKEEMRYLIPAPSYRLYMYLEDDELNVIISPEFRSHGGVIEAMGILLDRNPEHPLRYSEDEIKKFRQEFVSLALEKASSKP